VRCELRCQKIVTQSRKTQSNKQTTKLSPQAFNMLSTIYKAQYPTSAMTPLSTNFSPGSCDVICARGKEAKNHEGNRRYRAIIKKTLDRYAQVTSKYEKTVIVSEIVDAIRECIPSGGFVKQQGGVWFEVGDHSAREKVGQSLRDSLHNLYSSSAKAKRRRRGVVSAGIVSKAENLILSNEIVWSRMDKMAAYMKQRGDATPEVFVSQIFTQANMAILEDFKKDEILRNKFNEAEVQQTLCLYA
jgi:hypothetical protein